PLLPDIKIISHNNLDELKHITHNTAAVIIEPIQGEAGIRAASKEYLQELRDTCNKHGAILIFDEIQSGFGRTGSLFAYEQYGVVPDVLLMAKGMGGGLPIGALIASKELLQHFTNNPVLGHINTFGGNAVCVAAAQASLDVILQNQLIQRALTIEKFIHEHLKHPLIQEIRSCGALAAIEFGDEKLNMQIIQACIENGIITDWFLFCPTAMRLAPPLVISNVELLKAIDKIIEVLNLHLGAHES
ncbi:MAG: aminotransferase class III-fold pyridoxal phosphate-dependent enzyme, partial [Bacteroidota bacterium]